jgi:hypothetical protein
VSPERHDRKSIAPQSRAAERLFFIASAAVISALCFAGFARSYYLRAWLGKRALAPILHLHGLVMTAWIGLFAIQIMLVAKHRTRLRHRRLHPALGWGSAVLLVLDYATYLAQIAP